MRLWGCEFWTWMVPYQAQWAVIFGQLSVERLSVVWLGSNWKLNSQMSVEKSTWCRRCWFIHFYIHTETGPTNTPTCLNDTSSIHTPSGLVGEYCRILTSRILFCRRLSVNTLCLTIKSLIMATEPPPECVFLFASLTHHHKYCHPSLFTHCSCLCRWDEVRRPAHSGLPLNWEVSKWSVIGHPSHLLSPHFICSVTLSLCNSHCSASDWSLISLGSRCMTIN